jgi:predicted glycosyltransferase
MSFGRAPITVRDVALPEHVIPISVYPLLRWMRAFDVFAGAAGYNTCCEVMLSGVPSLLVPNTRVQDDQTRRAGMLQAHAPVVVSPCETAAQRAEAVAQVLALDRAEAPSPAAMPDGAAQAADEILALIGRGEP